MNEKKQLKKNVRGVAWQPDRKMSMGSKSQRNCQLHIESKYAKRFAN